MSTFTPGPDYRVVDTGVFKRRSLSIRFSQIKSPRLEPLKRQSSQDYFDTVEAAKKTQKQAPLAEFSKAKKMSFVEHAATKNKVPGVGAYKTDRAYTLLSPSPLARKR